MNRRGWLTVIGIVMSVGTPSSTGKMNVAWYRLEAPAGTHTIDQGSGLCFGTVAGHSGLWVCCDRNGGESAGHIYLIAQDELRSARPDGTIRAAAELTVTAPKEGWESFGRRHGQLSADVRTHLKTRIEARSNGDGMQLDLEAITIGESANAPGEKRLFVVAEEPYSLILELTLAPGADEAALAGAYRYPERDDEHGIDFNDGLEGLAYAGQPGLFYWAEEGTKLHKPDAHPRLFMSQPRVGLCRLAAESLFRMDADISERLTAQTRACAKGDSQTINDLAVTESGALLELDRNGGWILQADPRHGACRRWLNLYDLDGVNLRKALAGFPGPRKMPYVSMEGLAVDGSGDLWLVDDPAMPEPFRASCLVRISGVQWPATGPAQAESLPTGPRTPAPAAN